MKKRLLQYPWFRRWLGGDYYLIGDTSGVYWRQTFHNNDRSTIIKKETYAY